MGSVSLCTRLLVAASPTRIEARFLFVIKREFGGTPASDAVYRKRNTSDRRVEELYDVVQSSGDIRLYSFVPTFLSPRHINGLQSGPWACRSKLQEHDLVDTRGQTNARF